MANNNLVTPNSTEAISTLIDPGIKKHFYNVLKEEKPQFDKIFKIENLEGAYEDEANYATIGDVPEVGELENYSEDGVIPTYTTRYTASKFGVLIPVSYELWEDQKSKVVGRTEDYARAVTRTIDGDSASVFINAFDTSYTSYGDAKPLCSVSHPSGGGFSAQSNASATGVVFSETSLETGMLAMRNQKDDRDHMVSIIPDTLLVPPALEKKAIEVTRSELRSNTGNNDINAYNLREYTGGKLKLVVWDRLGTAAGGSDTAWFLLDSRTHGVTWKWRVKPQVNKLHEAVGAKNDVMYWKIRYRATYGWSRWQGVWGSKGDGQAYAS